MRLHDARKDLLSGAIFTGFGLAFAITSSTYELGTPLRMGPGLYPLVLGGILVVLGVSIAVKGFFAGEGGEIGAVPWKSLLLLLAAILFFGFTVRDLGLAPALFVAVLLAGLAGRSARVIPSVVIAVVLTVVSIVIFVYMLQLRLPLIGPWLGG